MSRICELTGKSPRKGSKIWRVSPRRKAASALRDSHTKRRFFPNLQRVKAVETEKCAISVRERDQKGLVVKPPKVAEALETRTKDSWIVWHHFAG